MSGVGIDLIEIADVREAMEAFGERYLGRIFTPAERRECRASPARLAERFAAKEAAMKALGRQDEAIGWQAIEVTTDAGGRPSIRLEGAAAGLARRHGVRCAHVSMSVDQAHAGAVVIMEGER
jgi:holo-[acyl-carrier protein] synthase